MKNIALSLLIALFFANTIVVSAWGAPCLKQVEIEASYDMAMNMDDEAPCHDGQQKAQDHCEGLCFCLHAAIHQTPVVDALAISAPHLLKERIAALDDRAASLIFSPALRPPIQNS